MEFNYTTPIQTTVPSTLYTADSTTGTTSPSLSQIMCHEGWEVFQGRCYYFVNEGLTWSQAQSNCALLESMLASVHSTEEYSFLQQLVHSNENTQAWLGGFYLQDQWLWIDGSWFYNNSWSFELPESANPCLTLSTFEASGSLPCNTFSYSSICVKNSNVRK
uniref:ladderlectin-like n=1 Tax=Scatophagus argus TaxID=75038 RepID=UPI001ED7ED3F|nr:ladderlectin-like [Scatophagus argus]